jgi:hypothetical protein
MSEFVLMFCRVGVENILGDSVTFWSSWDAAISERWEQKSSALFHEFTEKPSLHTGTVRA